jgi:hypothetical protein
MSREQPKIRKFGFLVGKYFFGCSQIVFSCSLLVFGCSFGFLVVYRIKKKQIKIIKEKHVYLNKII